ncbi:MAG TPA: NADH-quinone oxidoreductase subunit H [Planctomycetes bacterium]|nr:NADH-quinone oxidoreductase subunit H [Planctomycetota bacterium]HIJ71558.1 NADH-quinone oxidoreductase subunit H [Planctomycetota bacterium]
MSEVVQNLFWILVFPGFLFTVGLGLLASWIVRKVSALVQHRVGPPMLQPVYDVIKLLGKETLIPEAGQRATFMFSPLIGFSAVLLLSTMLWRISFVPASPFVGDIIVAIYLMVIPSLALILGSSASASPQASMGTAREMKLVVAYELPLVLAFLVVIIKTAGAVGDGRQLSLAAIAEHAPVLSISGMIAFLSALLCVQAKLGFVPFDIAEAETELASGVLIEYSGALLAMWTLMQGVMLVALPLFLVVAFLGGFGSGAWGILAGAGKYVLVLVLIILIKNTNPRVRIDQAMRFFWFWCGTAAVVAVALAILGNLFSIGWL